MSSMWSSSVDALVFKTGAFRNGPRLPWETGQQGGSAVTLPFGGSAWHSAWGDRSDTGLEQVPVVPFSHHTWSSGTSAAKPWAKYEGGVATVAEGSQMWGYVACYAGSREI